MAESGLTLAVVFGCSEEQKKEIIRRLDTVDLVNNHPLLLPGLIAELERIRLVGRVDNLLDNFALRASADQELDLDMDKTKLATYLKLCYESRDLINQMEADKRQLTKMKTTKFGNTIASKNTGEQFPVIPISRKRLRLAGQQINARLDEIFSEYSDKINDCKMVIENMSLTMQTVSRTSLQGILPFSNQAA